MPVISSFFGVTVSMYFLDNRRHHRQHVHARYQNDEAVVAIDDGEVLEGNLPQGKLRLVLAWMEIHREDSLGRLATSREWRASIEDEPVGITHDDAGDNTARESGFACPISPIHLDAENLSRVEKHRFVNHLRSATLRRRIQSIRT
jgi:hypothetical protein